MGRFVGRVCTQLSKYVVTVYLPQIGSECSWEERKARAPVGMALIPTVRFDTIKSSFKRTYQKYISDISPTGSGICMGGFGGD